MNTKRIIFWASFIIILVLIIWGLVVAMNKEPIGPNGRIGTPAPVTSADNVIGPSDAPVTIVEYSDFECPACQTYYYVVEKVLASSTVPVRFVYRHFPLSQHKNAMPASLASEAAGVQGKFWDMYKLIFENHTDWTPLKDAGPVFYSYAQKLGLDMEKFKTDLASSSLKEKITASIKEGTDIGISGTPTFFVNGKVIENPSSYEAFKTIIEEAAK